MWWWKYVMGLESTDQQADALWLGIGVHLALAQWYRPGFRRGTRPATVFERWAGEEIRYARTYLDDDFNEPAWEDATELGIAMLKGYFEHYGKDDTWEVISTEQPFAVRITKKGEPLAVFKSRWDGVYRDREDGQIYLMEHKTAGSISLPYLELDDQGGSYWAVAGDVLRAKGVLKSGEEIAGITYNFLRKAMPDLRPRNEEGQYLNKNGSVSLKQPSPLFVREYVERSPKERATQMRRIADEVEIMNGMRNGTIPVVKRTTKDCPRCEFWNMCLLHERGGNAWKQIMKSSYTVVDPYAEYQKSAGE
jgi:hypothetical protein